MATTKRYRIEPLDGSTARTVTGTSYTFDQTSGRHTIKDGRELVASLLNVNVTRLSESEEQPEQPE